MRTGRKAIIVMMFASLTGCAGVASPYTAQALFQSQQACAQGDPNACAAVPMLQQQAYMEAQVDAQNRTAAAATAVGALAILGAAVGVAASNNGGYHSYHHYHHRGW